MGRLAVALAAVALAAGCGGGSEQGAAPPVALLTGVHVDGGRAVFDFRSAPDAVRTRFQKPAEVAESGSGRHVPVRGTTALIVTFTPAATAEIRGEDVVPTYTGPKRIEGGGPIREVVKVGDFESQLDWAIGLEARGPFRVERDGDRVAVVFGPGG